MIHPVQSVISFWGSKGVELLGGSSRLKHPTTLPVPDPHNDSHSVADYFSIDIKLSDRGQPFMLRAYLFSGVRPANLRIPII